MAMNGTVLLCTVNVRQDFLEGNSCGSAFDAEGGGTAPLKLRRLPRKVTTATCRHAMERMSDLVTTCGSGGEM
jgi:hypothetical protein